MVARLSVHPSEECSLFAGTEVALAFLLGVLTILQESSRVIDGRWQRLAAYDPAENNDYVAGVVVSLSNTRGIFKVTKRISFHPHLSTSYVSDRLQHTPISFATKRHGRRTRFRRDSPKPLKQPPKPACGMSNTWMPPKNVSQSLNLCDLAK